MALKHCAYVFLSLPVRDIGDDDVAIVVEAHGASVLAHFGAALRGARAVSKIESRGEFLFEIREMRLTSDKVIKQRRKLGRREG
ncbi:MAG: hypothetical protein Q8M31_23985 [Beijerinckiaceae bacterium]|nr:hypothetical protein [Beijerinckiaceae bacterium]